MEFDGFDWDDGNWPKCGKHGVGQAEIEALLRRAYFPTRLMLSPKCGKSPSECRL